MSDEKKTSRPMDLFGNPVGPGRPPFEWSLENSNKVKMLLSLGWSNDRIRGCIINPKTQKPISLSTLKRYFRAELRDRQYMRDRLMARQFEVTFYAAMDGNVGAMRLLEKMRQANDSMESELRLAQKVVDDKPVESLGKKQISEQAAVDADARMEKLLEQEAMLVRPN